MHRVVYCITGRSCVEYFSRSIMGWHWHPYRRGTFARVLRRGDEVLPRGGRVGPQTAREMPEDLKNVR